jgi:hypothetical protein
VNPSYLVLADVIRVIRTQAQAEEALINVVKAEHVLCASPKIC